MQPRLDMRSEWHRLQALGQRGAVILSLFLGLGAVQADTTNFMGDFGEAFWTKQPQFGSVYFTNSDTKLVLAGPNAPAAETTSFDGVLYNGDTTPPLSGGLAVGGTVQFHYDYNGGTTLSTSEADFAYTPPGGSPSQLLIAQGGAGVVTSGLFKAPLLIAGTTFEILLGSDTTSGKLAASLIITDFEFHPDIPEPSTGALLASALISLGVASWRRSRRQR